MKVFIAARTYHAAREFAREIGLQPNCWGHLGRAEDAIRLSGYRGPLVFWLTDVPPEGVASSEIREAAYVRNAQIVMVNFDRLGR